MLILALKPGHDGAIAAVEDRRLIMSLESEKDSFPRHSAVTPTSVLQALERLDAIPDVFALGGWLKRGRPLGAGYMGVDEPVQRAVRMLGKEATFFTSTHERSHIMMAIGMAPKHEPTMRAVLVWEGAVGAFYLVDHRCEVVQTIPVLGSPGARFAFLFAIADPPYPDKNRTPRMEDAGKLMALAGFGDPSAADRGIVETVERLMTMPGMWPLPKSEFADSCLYNAGVESEACKIAAALLADRIFDTYADAARQHLPEGLPLFVSGGCGLNCEWNVKWRDLGHFASVFVPPCTNDSGSAVGTALDALASTTGDPYVDWSVYCGLEFEWDAPPNPEVWTRRELDEEAVAAALEAGRVFAWVQGRTEIGPRALGNRSLLAEPFRPETKDRLNEIKQREDYRPIAPCCRLEDVGAAYDRDFPDPYMLYFRRAARSDLGAVTHVDGSARCQTVSKEENPPLHRLLSAFAERTGVGLLCNTSLNFKGTGFINRMSDLARYCEKRGIDDFVVGSTWFRRATRDMP